MTMITSAYFHRPQTTCNVNKSRSPVIEVSNYTRCFSDWLIQDGVLQTIYNNHTYNYYHQHSLSIYTNGQCVNPTNCVTKAGDTRTRNWYQSSGTRNSHVCQSIW